MVCVSYFRAYIFASFTESLNRRERFSDVLFTRAEDNRIIEFQNYRSFDVFPHSVVFIKFAYISECEITGST